MSDRRIVGQSVAKADAYDKVKGTAKYAADFVGEGFLVAKAVRSPYAHAMIKGIKVEKAMGVPGVVAVLTAKDIPGQNRIGMTGVKDQRVLAEEKVRFLGEAVAVVVAESEEACRAASKLVDVEYEELPVVTDPEEALAPSAPLIGDEQTNLCFYRKIIKGNFDEALAQADLVLRGEYRIKPVDHAYVEPEATTVIPENGGLHLYTTTKSAHLEQKEVARVLGWPVEKVRVTAATIGGSFGGKPDLALDCMAALASAKTGRPVRMVYTREESLQVTTKRHSFIIRYTHACKRDGTLLGVKADMIADAGAYVDYSPTVLLRSVIGGAGPYRVPNVFLEVRGVLTNNPVAGAMRGFGLPQVTFACERQMDRLADALGLDPWEFRLRNLLVEGDSTSTGQVLVNVHLKETLNKARELVLEAEASDSGEPLKPYEKRAWGIACAYYGNGRTGMPNPGVAQLRLRPDGLVEVAVGSPDIGQGSNTLLRQVAADALGVELDHIVVITGDTSLTPDSGTTSGTRVTTIVGKAVELVTREFRAKLLEAAAKLLDVEAVSLSIVCDGNVPRVTGPKGCSITFEEIALKAGPLETMGDYNPPTTPLDENGHGVPYATYTYGTQCARVKVNTYTGKVEVEKLISVYDVGTVVNPVLLKGQMEGGIAMGLGYALMEDLQLSQGKVLNSNFDGYILPTSLDVPAVSFEALPTCDHVGPFGAKGVGEPGILPTAAAIANAVSRALGVDVYNLPLNLEEVNQVLEKASRSK